MCLNELYHQQKHLTISVSAFNKKIVNSLSLVLSSSTPLMESASRDDSRLVGVRPCVIAGITTLQVTRRPVITRLLQFGLIESIAFHTNHLLKQSACELLIWIPRLQPEPLIFHYSTNTSSDQFWRWIPTDSFSLWQLLTSIVTRTSTDYPKNLQIKRAGWLWPFLDYISLL